MTTSQGGQSGGSQDKSDNDADRLKAANATIVQLRKDVNDSHDALKKAEAQISDLTKANTALVKDNDDLNKVLESRGDGEVYTPPADNINGADLYEVVSTEQVGDSFVVTVIHDDDNGVAHQFSWAADSDQAGWKNQMDFWAKRRRIQKLEGMASATPNTGVAPVAEG